MQLEAGLVAALQTPAVEAHIAAAAWCSFGFLRTYSVAAAAATVRLVFVLDRTTLGQSSAALRSLAAAHHSGACGARSLRRDSLTVTNLEQYRPA